MARPHDLLRDVARGDSVSGSMVDKTVVRSAVEHRVAGLLLQSLWDSKDRDPDVLLGLIALDMAGSERQSVQRKTLKHVHQRLSEAEIPHTFIKGLISGMRWFDRPGQRPYADIDVVVPSGDHLLAATRILDPTHRALSILETGAVTSVDILLDDVWVDIQTDALRTGLTPLSQSWVEGSDRLELDEETALSVLDPEHDMVMFLLHLERDRFRYLLGIAEANRRLQYPIDWTKVEEIARREGIWEQVAVALAVVCDELERSVPVQAPRNWRTSLWRRLWSEDVRLLGDVSRVRYIMRAQFLMPLTMRGRFVDALRWLLRRAFPPDALLRHRYPEARGPYLWRVTSNRVRVRSQRRLWVRRNPGR